jgi:RimJ/RimL family protein N-acetyltransferase
VAVSHIELRPLEDDDLDAVFEMMRDPDARAMVAFAAADADDRGAFDEWMGERRGSDAVSLSVVTERGGFAGTAAAFAVGSDREVSVWLARHAWGRGVGTDALGLLVSREAERPLFARSSAGNTAWTTILEHAGFTEVSRSTVFAPGLDGDVDEIVYALLPALDGS